MSGSTFQQVSLSLQLIAKLAVLWIALLVLPFAERTLLGAKTYYFLYIGLGTGLCAVWANDPLHFRFFTAYKTRAGLRLDCVPSVVRLYLQHSGSLRYRIRPSSPHAGAINCA